MKLGLLGGTFNPVHTGHLLIAETVLRACDLAQVLLIPAAQPPHKAVDGEVSFAHRLAMVEAAVAGREGLAVSDLEGRRPGPSYSVDTLEELRRQRPGDVFYLIIGMDSFRDLPTWKQWQRLFDLAHVVVLGRPGVQADRGILRAVAADPAVCYASRAQTVLCASGNSVIFLEEMDIPMASSEIRRRLAAGAPVDPWLPEPVRAYIRRHRLYGVTS